MSRPRSITVSRSKRGTTVKASGRAAQALFEAMVSDDVARLAALRQQPHTLVFEDHGQDFLEWDVDADGVVTASRPFQHDLWAGCVVLNAPEVGDQVRLFSRSLKRETCIAYRIKRIVMHLPAPATSPHGNESP